MDAIRYVVDNGCKWRNLPADFLVPWRTVHAIFTRWWQDGDVYALHNDLREQVRVTEGREPEPSAGIIDSQSLRAAETVARDSRGYDAAKNVQGTKRRIIVDTLCLLLVVIVTAAGAQDRDGAKPALERLHDWHERISLVWPTARTPASSCPGPRSMSKSPWRSSDAAMTSKGLFPPSQVGGGEDPVVDLPAPAVRPRL
ncbi:transposase [Nonomuraea sp. JJY05]|jgi:transposase|uniref:transposase n=1 Tax=Nonomuraea sp. JJY05 TaxID=3350255 RepID=UPI00373DFC8F